MKYSLKRNRPTLMPAVALAALGALVAIPALSQSRLYAAAPERFATVTVAQGQNLWAIAERFTPDGGDVQETIENIMTANGLSNSTVIAGEHLKVPR